MLHSKLRLECSDLRFHLFRRNLCASVCLLRIQSIIFYVVLNLTTTHTLTDYTDVNIALLLYGLLDLDVRIYRHVLKWSTRLSQEVKYLLSYYYTCSWFTYSNLNMFYKTFLLFSYTFFLLLITNYYLLWCT